MKRFALLYHREIRKYDFGECHPFRGDRFQVFMDFFGERFIPFKDRFEIIKPQPATEQILKLVHSEDYIEAIKTASRGRKVPNIYKYVSADNLNPLFRDVPPGIEEGARIIVGSSVSAGELIAEGRFEQAIVIGGGLHHAKPAYGEGFCFYNDVAVLIKHLKRKYNLNRILVLDTDAHAGNGTAEIFYNDPCVLFIDVHQDPRTIYPGTGFISEIGRGEGEGFTVNLSLLPSAAQDDYEYIFDEIVFPLAREFKPQLFIRYGGSDPHYLDGLAHLGLTLDGFKMIGRFVREISREVCEGRDIDLLTSGYNLTILPFAWSALISGLVGLDIDLSGIEERPSSLRDSRLNETKDMVSELKKFLKKYWRCMNK